MDSPRGLEEERCLFYVAITRAEEYLIITHAKSRFRYGKTEFCEPSRFLREIDPRFLRVKGVSASASAGIARLGQTGMSSLPPSGASRSPSSGFRQSVPTGIDARRFVRVKTAAQSAGEPSQAGTVTKDVPNVSVGTRILHERFGSGVVTAIEGKGIDSKATVDFQNVGVKQLLLRFAKFKIAD